MLVELALAVALDINQVTTDQLVKLYWDCDTQFMKNDLQPQEMMSCLAIYDEFKQRLFKGDFAALRRYWLEHREAEWRQRGYEQYF